MIASIFHDGSGLGNQLHSYVMARVLALDKGTDFGMVNPEKFKGRRFMNLDMGKKVHPIAWFDDGIVHEYHEKSEKNEGGHEVRDYDWDGVLHIKDNTLIDGYWQGEKYYEHHLDKIREWLKTEHHEMPDDLCVINFRGGEYVGVADLFLPQSYWDEAIEKMLAMNPAMRFEVHTDDPETAELFFPTYPIIRNLEVNWRSIRHAKYLILSNSSFAILPALMNDESKLTIAPTYWAGYNKGYWQLKQNFYKKFTYI